MSLKTGSSWSNWAWDKPVKAFIWRSSRMCRPIGGLPPWFFEDSLPHLLWRDNSTDFYTGYDSLSCLQLYFPVKRVVFLPPSACHSVPLFLAAVGGCQARLSASARWGRALCGVA